MAFCERLFVVTSKLKITNLRMIKKYRSDCACYDKIMPLNKILLLKKCTYS